MAAITVKNVEIPHGELKLKGRIYKADGEGRKPSAIICHGYPGDTKNMDMAEDLAINGYNVLVFYYAGAWGSEGTYRFRNLTPSTKSALDWLLEKPYVDTNRVALISHSMGAVPLTNLMSVDNRVKTGVLMSPASDLAPWLGEDVIDTIFTVFRTMSEGKLATGDDAEYKTDMIEAGKNLNPMDRIADIKAPIMVIVGSSDDVTTPDACRGLFDKASEPKKWVLVDGADHSFTEHRIPLQKEVLVWLRKEL
jgi:dienelactone hydrolase